MPLGEWLADAAGFLVAATTVIVALWASGHAILYKRDTRATVLWVSFIWLAPIAGNAAGRGDLSRHLRAGE